MEVAMINGVTKDNDNDLPDAGVWWVNFWMYVFGALSHECRVEPDGSYYEIGGKTYPGNPDGRTWKVKQPVPVVMPDGESKAVVGGAHGDNTGQAKPVVGAHKDKSDAHGDKSDAQGDKSTAPS
jgi:hypothetical protein